LVTLTERQNKKWVINPLSADALMHDP